MLIGWIYPHREKCGIAIYSRAYLATEALRGITVDMDPEEFSGSLHDVRKKLKSCDIVHVQYEAGAFYSNKKDLFQRLLSLPIKQLVVSLHEVYELDPFVFRRDGISGVGLLKRLREMLYDKRHPVQTCHARHLECQFGARIITVHHEYHIGILTGKKIDREKIRVVEHPVPRAEKQGDPPFGHLPQVNLSVCGFLNPAYDVDLLYKVLDGLRRPWKFTWIGGLRNEKDRGMLESMNREIDIRKWAGRFEVTGWVSEEDMKRNLMSTDIVLALFTFRSSSGTIARALGAGRPVVATRIPLTNEIVETAKKGSEPPLLLADSTPEAVIEKIEDLCSDKSIRQKLAAGIEAYCCTHDFESSAKQLVSIYQEMIKT
jgi:glycosyltransferase involved in cell wall biosynthesis